MIWLLTLAIAFAGVSSPSGDFQPADCATPVAMATPVPVGACGWPDLVGIVDAALAGQSNDDFEFGERSEPQPATALPEGWSDGALWRAELPNGGGLHWVALLRFDDAASAASRSASHQERLLSAGFTAEASKLDPGGECFALIREESARAVCSINRGELMIVGYSFFEIDHADGQIHTASAFVQFVQDAVDEAGRLR